MLHYNNNVSKILHFSDLKRPERAKNAAKIGGGPKSARLRRRVCPQIFFYYFFCCAVLEGVGGYTKGVVVGVCGWCGGWVSGSCNLELFQSK